MLKLCILAGTMIVGYAFWWAADALDCSFFVSFMISGVGSVVGCWAGWKIFRHYFT